MYCMGIICNVGKKNCMGIVLFRKFGNKTTLMGAEVYAGVDVGDPDLFFWSRAYKPLKDITPRLSACQDMSDDITPRAKHFWYQISPRPAPSS